MSLDSQLKVAAVVMLAACIAVPLANRAKLSAVLGYLVAGVILGPSVMGIIMEPSDVMHFSEFGVVLFMFLIGLELNISKLWHMRGPIVGLGALQVLSCAAIFSLIIHAFGMDLITSLIGGFGFALSSTAIALQILGERNMLRSPPGELGFSMLLFQDLIVIPVLVLIPLLNANLNEAPQAHANGSSLWTGALNIIGIIALIAIGRRFIRPIFRIIAATRTREIFTAFSLLIITSVSVGMHSAGLSMALGAFLAGVLLSDSEYRHELEAHIEPFKGLLLGLFFLSVGMSLDFATLGKAWTNVIGILALILILKSGIIYAATRLFKLAPVEALFIAGTLSQCGEFGFVLFGLAHQSGVISSENLSILNGVVALSMFSTSLIILAIDKINTWRPAKLETMNYPLPSDDRPEVIIAGHGRFGQITSRLLRACGVKTTLIDHSADVVESTQKFRIKAYYGDATRRDLLEAAGIERAKAIVIAIDDRDAATKITKELKTHYPNKIVVSRAYDLLHAYELLDAGADHLERETFDAAVSMGRNVLKLLGVGSYQAEQAAQKFRQHDVESMYKLHKTRADEHDYLTRALEAREEIEKTLTEDQGIAQIKFQGIAW